MQQVKAEENGNNILNKVYGHVDSIHENIIEGWAYSPSFVNKRLTVRAVLNGQVVAETIADIYREDLRANKIGDGNYAYRLEIPKNINAGKINVVEKETSLNLIGSPIDLKKDTTNSGNNLDAEINYSSKTMPDPLSKEIIKDCYHYILGRSPDPEGLSSYACQINNGKAVFDLAVELFFSSENISQRKSSAELAESILKLALKLGPLSRNWRGLINYIASTGGLLKASGKKLSEVGNKPGSITGFASIQQDGSLSGWAVDFDSPYSPMEIVIQAGSTIESLKTSGAPNGIKFRTVSKTFALMSTDVKVTANKAILSLSKDNPSLTELLVEKLERDRHWFWNCLNNHDPEATLTEGSPLSTHFRSKHPSISDFMLYVAAQKLDYEIDITSSSCRSRLLEWYVNDFREQWGSSSPLPFSEKLRQYLQSPAFAEGISPIYISRLLFLFWKRHFNDKQMLFDKDQNRWLVYKLFSSPNGGLASFIKVCGEQLLIPLLIRHPQSKNLILPLNWYWYYGLSEEFKTKNIQQVDPLDYLSSAFRKLFFALASGQHLSLIPNEWFKFWSYDDGTGLSRAERLLKRLLSNSSDSDQETEKWLNSFFYEKYPQFKILRTNNSEFLTPQAAVKTARTAIVEKKQVGDYFYIVGHTSQTGLGANLWMSVEALKKAGIEPVIASVDQQTIELDTVMMSKATKLNQPVVLFHVNADRAPIELSRLPPTLQKDAYRIGFFLWETSMPPATHMLGLDLMDEIWVPTEYLAELYRKYTDKPVFNVRKGLKVPDKITSISRESLNLSEEEFIFLTIGDFHSSIPRKNPLGVVRAFKKAFPNNEKVKLLLKIRNIEHEHWSNKGNHWDRVEEEIMSDPRITVFDGDLEYSQYWGLIQACDCFISMHKAEGFGYGLAHAMLMEKPVITSDYSGSQDFCNSSNAFLIPVTEVEVAEHEMPVMVKGARWGQPDLEVAAQHMRTVVENPEKIEGKIKSARKTIEKHYSMEAHAERYYDQLKNKIIN
ncbi:glycosyltransferase [Salinicola sp. MIT1003]|uniref:glycosyltransferase family 4 protein n=1 Tax=Salinicola sp. MIT1003 TaxID=1882734 RepID=UPI000A77ED8C|nr:glycosyltransferase [Salinicola sp. MIT1003]